jgi:sugar lactone lactonase YvrE
MIRRRINDIRQNPTSMAIRINLLAFTGVRKFTYVYGMFVIAQIVFSLFSNSATFAQDLYVSTETRVLRYTANGVFVSEFVPAGYGGVSNPTGIAFGPDHNLYESNATQKEVMRFAGASGYPLASAGGAGAIYVPAGSGGLLSPHGLAFGGDGKLYVASGGAPNGVLRYDVPSATFLSNFTSSQPPSGVLGVTFGGPIGNLYTCGGHEIWCYFASNGTVFPPPIPPGGPAPFATDPGAAHHYDLKFGPSGDLFVTAYETSKVLRFNGITGAPMPDFVSAGAGGLSRPMGLVFGSDGNLYVVSTGTKQILRYNGSTGSPMGAFASTKDYGEPAYVTFGSASPPLPRPGKDSCQSQTRSLVPMSGTHDPIDFSAAYNAASVPFHTESPNHLVLCTFKWESKPCCKVTSATLHVKMHAVQNGTVYNDVRDADPANDRIGLFHLGTGETSPSSEYIYPYGNFPSGTVAHIDWPITGIALANLQTDHRLSFLVEDDTAIDSATLDINECCPDATDTNIIHSQSVNPNGNMNPNQR